LRHRLLSIDGPRTDVTDVETRQYYADDDPNAARRGRLERITAPGGLVTTFDDYDTFGTARHITDPNGVVTTLQTDPRGRVTTTTSQSVGGDPNESSAYTSITTFDGRDRVTETVNARNIRTGFDYEEGTNRLTATIRYDAGGNQAERLQLTLSALGWKTSEDAQACVSPAPTCLAWSTPRTESFAYDDDGRLTTTTHADGNTVVYAYDAASRLQTVKDENHASANTTYGYDALGRLTTVTQTLAGAPGGVITTSYTYDVQDNRSPERPPTVTTPRAT
jgi:YD repeat-containing protein